MNKNKKGDIKRGIILQLILVTIVLALFMVSLASKIDGRGVKQDIIENQIALMIEAGVPGITYEVFKLNSNGRIDDVELDDGRVYVTFDGLKSSDGRVYFSVYDVEIIEETGKFLVRITNGSD